MPALSWITALRVGLVLLPTIAARLLAADLHLSIDDAALHQGEAQRDHAAAQLLTPTPLHLQGHLTLAACVAALAASGNPTTLDAGTDPTLSAEIHQDGPSYWDAVAAVCRAFALHPVPGATAALDGLRMTTVPVESGPLLLSAAAAPPVMLESCGGLLAVVDTFSVKRRIGEHHAIGIDIAVHLRLEPHLTQQHLGWSSVVKLTVNDEHGHELQHTPAAQPENNEDPQTFNLQSQGNALAMHLDTDTTPASVQISAEALMQMAENWRIATSLSGGDTATIDCIGRTLTLTLIDGDHQGPNGTHGPLLTLDFPHEAVESDPHVSVSRNGGEVGSRGGGVFDTVNGRTVLNALVQLDKDPYQVVVNGASPLGGPQHLTLHLSLPLAALTAPALSIPETTQFQPSHVSWPAGHLTIGQAIANLTSGGNRVLLELGADESQQRDLPAFSGSFWEGLLLVGQTFHLAPRSDDDSLAGGPAAPSGITLGSGPVSLAAQPDTSGLQAVGALLVSLTSLSTTEVHALSGSGHRLDATLRLRLEPRVDDETIGQCFCALDTFATDNQGRQVTLMESKPAPGETLEVDNGMRIRLRRMRGAQFGNQQPAAPEAHDVDFTVSDLPDQCTSLTVTGQLRVHTQRRIHHEVSLAVGGTITVASEEGSFHFTLLDQAAAEAAGLSSPGLVVNSDNGNLPNSILLFSTTGASLGCNGTERLPRSGLQMLYHFPVAEAGPYRLVVDDIAQLAVVKLPVRTTITISPTGGASGHPAAAP